MTTKENVSRPYKVTIRVSEEELRFLESFSDKKKSEVLRWALNKYMTRVLTVRAFVKRNQVKKYLYIKKS